VKVSARSWVLLLGFIPAPITVVRLRVASLRQRQAIAMETRSLLGFDPGLIPMMLVLLGILCFVGFLVSIVADYFRTR
jgi:hypothetical protein